MEIKKITPKYLDELAESFVASFSEWDKKSAHQYFLQAYKACPDFCLVAVENKKIVLGGIFCRITPYNDGRMLLVESLQIKTPYRNKKVGTLLMREVVKRAKRKHIGYIGLLASKNTKHPLNWLKKIGFNKTGWVELAAKVSEIHV